MIYQQLCRDFKFNRERLIQVKPLFTAYPRDQETRDKCFSQMEPGTFFICEDGGLPEGSTYWITVVRTEKSLYFFHSEIAECIQIDGDKYHSSYTKEPKEEFWKQMFLDIGPCNFELSHYDYLELVINEFWRGVFGKTTSEMWCAGIIGAHGDKAYGYKDQWDDAGIHFARGVLLFLLTYTKELGDTPKHESCEWVIANYQKYLPYIAEAEKLAGLA